MSEQTPQAPQVEELDIVETISPDEETAANNAAASDDPSQLSYHEYLKLMNPDKSDAEIAKMIRKENRYTWLVRFQILAIIVFLILILVFIFIK